MWIILIDHSTSMGDPFHAPSESVPGRSRTTGEDIKLSAAKLEIVRHLSGLRRPQRIALFEFTSKASLIFEGLSSQGESIQVTLDALLPADGTDVAAALDKAANFVETRSEPIEGLCQVLMITDGLSEPAPAREAAMRLWNLIDVLSVILIDPTPKGSALALEISLESSVENVVSASALSEGADRLFERHAEIARALDEVAERYREESSSLANQTPAAERLSFTAAYPGRITPEAWHVLLVYLHLSELRGRVQSILERKASQLDFKPVISEAESGNRLTRGTVLTMKPNIDGIVFNPSSVDIVWYEDIQEVPFRFIAAVTTPGRSLLGSIEVYARGLLISQIPLAMTVRRAGEAEETEVSETRTARAFETIFASYSHEDAGVVEACVAVYKALGIYVLWDRESLRSGDYWALKLKKLIGDSDIFQLYWSPPASRSEYVKEEWKTALGLVSEKGQGFIRPLYWERPMQAPPDALSHIQFELMELSVFQGARPSRPTVTAPAPRANSLTSFPVTVLPLLSAAGAEEELRDDMASAVQFLETTTGLRYYPAPTLIVDEYIIKSVRAATTVDSPPEDKLLRQRASATASLLQSLALDFHVAFREAKLPLDRGELFQRFGRGSEVTAEIFDQAIGDCEWIIGRMIEQALRPAWINVPRTAAEGEPTFSDSVVGVLSRIISSASDAPQRTFLNIDAARIKLLDPVSSILTQTRLKLAKSVWGTKLEGSTPSLYEALGLVRDEFSVALSKYDGRSALRFFGGFSARERDEGLATLAVLICERLGIDEPIERIIGDIVAPLWRARRDLYNSLETSGVSSEGDFTDFMSAFLDIVERLLLLGLNGIGDFAYVGGYGMTEQAWTLARSAMPDVRLEARPYSYSRSGESEVLLSGRFSDICRVFAWANSELIAALKQLLPSGSAAQQSFVSAVPTYGIYAGPGAPEIDEKIKTWALARLVPTEMTLPGTPRVLFCLEARRRFEERLRIDSGDTDTSRRVVRGLQRSVLIHEHFHSVLEMGLDESSMPAIGPGFRDAWRDAISLNESLAVWMELHAAREDKDMRELVEGYITFGPYPEWPYRGAEAIEEVFKSDGVEGVRGLIHSIRRDPKAAQARLDSLISVKQKCAGSRRKKAGDKSFPSANSVP